MLRILDLLEYRFVVPGKAVSFRSPNARLYKYAVRRAAGSCLNASPLAVPVDLYLDYFHTSKRFFDMDNVAKCVLDALNGLAYTDDRLARVQSATAHDLRQRIELAGGPVDLAKPLRKYADYLFIRIRMAG